MTIEKLDMQTPDITDANVARIAELFPSVVTEGKDDNGNLVKVVDFDALKQELSGQIVEGHQERYRLDWPGKREAMLTANKPITKTLRPMREESVDFETTKNLFIEGDNLDALKLLQETYLGKVKMIYIDPPYNKNRDFVYNDNFSTERTEYLEETNQTDRDGAALVANYDSDGRFHSKWLTMIYPRLKLARNLLKDDGFVVISIDESEFPNLRRVCDEIFGANNCAGEIVWKNSSKNDQAYISMQHEYLVVYVKSKEKNSGNWVEKKAGLEKIYSAFSGFSKQHKDNWEAIHKEALKWFNTLSVDDPALSSKHYSWMDERGVYFPDNISGPNDGQYVYDLPHPLTGEVCKSPASGWRFPEDELKKRAAEGLVHFGKDHTTVPCNKTYLKNTEHVGLGSLRIKDSRGASARLKSLFDDQKVFTNPKDEFLLADLMKAMQVLNGDIVLDFFAGSGSTFHACILHGQQNHLEVRSLNVQLGESLERQLKVAQGSTKKTIKNAQALMKRLGKPLNVAEISKERLRRSGKKIREEFKGEAMDLDVGFRVLKIDDSNMNDVYYSPSELEQSSLLDTVEHIKADRTSEDLLFQVMLDWGVDLSLPITRETIEGKTVYWVGDNDLAACFDMKISEAVVIAIAATKPLRAVFRDDGFSSDDDMKINAGQLFKQMTDGHTDMKVV